MITGVMFVVSCCHCAVLRLCIRVPRLLLCCRSGLANLLSVGANQQSPPFLGHILWVDLIKPISMSVRTSVRNVCTYVRLLSLSTKSFLDSNEIWCVCGGQRMVHDGMPCDLIQGQGQRSWDLKVGNSAIFKMYLLPPLSMRAGKWLLILKLEDSI